MISDSKDKKNCKLICLTCYRIVFSTLKTMFKMLYYVYEETFAHYWRGGPHFLLTYHFLLSFKTIVVGLLLALCLNTIHIYIILKPPHDSAPLLSCLNTIHIYIILKLSFQYHRLKCVWIPYIFTSFSNCRYELFAGL